MSSGPVLMGALGDSLTSYGVAWGSTGLIMAYSNATLAGFPAWVQALSKGKVWIPHGGTWGNNSATFNYCQGTGGHTTVQILARLDSYLNIRPLPKILLCHWGTNDLTEANKAESAATMFARDVQIFNRVIDAGIVPVIVPISPRSEQSYTDRGLTAGETAFAKGKLLGRNDLLRQWSAGNSNVLFVDTYWNLLDPDNVTGSALATMVVADGLHYSAFGAYTIAKRIAAAIDIIMPFDYRWYGGKTDAYHATNQPYGAYFDASLSGVAGTVGAGTTGTVATGWNVNRLTGATSTAVATAQARTDGKPGNEQKVVITGAEVCQWRMYFGSSVVDDIAGSLWLPGDAVYWECEVQMSGTGMSLNPDFWFRNNNTTTQQAYSLYNTNTQGDVTADATLHLRSPLVVVGSGVDLSGFIVFGAVNTGSPTYTVREPVLRKYDRSQPNSVYPL